PSFFPAARARFDFGQVPAAGARKIDEDQRGAVARGYAGPMNFKPSATAQAWRQRLEAFIERYVLPHNAAWHRCAAEGDWPPSFMEDLKSLARAEGLWNLCLPGLRADEPGTRLANLDYAPL